MPLTDSVYSGHLSRLVDDRQATEPDRTVQVAKRKKARTASTASMLLAVDWTAAVHLDATVCATVAIFRCLFSLSPLPSLFFLFLSFFFFFFSLCRGRESGWTVTSTTVGFISEPDGDALTGRRADGSERRGRVWASRKIPSGYYYYLRLRLIY